MLGDPNRVRQGGWLTIEALIALTLVMLALPVVQGYYASYQLENTSMAAAKHLQRVEQAVEGYVKANWAAIEGAATDRTPVEISQSDLEDDGFLPTGFNMTNPFGQSYKSYVVNPSARSLVSVVIGEGGRPGVGILKGADLKLATEVIPGTARKVGLTGGVIPYTQMPGVALGTIEGTGGSWTLDVSTWSGGGFSQPKQGALAAVNFYVSGAVNNDYLYRKDIGVPELNRMETNLDMGGNSITGIKNITADGGIQLESDSLTGTDAIYAESGDITLKSGDVYASDIIFDNAKVWGSGGYVPMSASRAVYDMRLAQPRDEIRKPLCPATSVPQIFVAVDAAPTGSDISVATTSGPVTGNITSYRTNAENLNAQFWRINMQVYFIDATSSDGWYTLNASSGSGWSGSMLVGTKCT